MHKEFLMGNEAIALGALAAGVNLVSGYPGTPSTEVLETAAKRRSDDVYVEWSVNEKVGLEVAAGAAYSGARVMVTMKQVGLNVAADPLMSLEYIGVKGGMVILVADDPGPISSQTEQDTRSFASFAKVPVFDPSSVQEAYEMVQEAFAYSEKYHTPVFLRSTTRICHGYASITVKDTDEYKRNVPEGFKKDSSRWVIFPRLSFENHKKIEARNTELSDVFSAYERNIVWDGNRENNNKSAVKPRKGIATHGISYGYTMDSLSASDEVRLMKVATPFPFPEKLALHFLKDLDEVLCLEELDPVIERALIYVCGKYRLKTKIIGKLTGHVQNAGENTVDSVKEAIDAFLHAEASSEVRGSFENSGVSNLPVPKLPVRPPVLCAGCPHRASFFAVKQAMRGKKTIYCGDIGCYTLGNAKPLDMVDTCLCMGAGIGIAQGVGHLEPDTFCFSFVGDSTFFASGIPEVVNAVYNQANLTLIVLDNSTTAMTGHQPHPGTGRTMMGQIVDKVSIEKILYAIGLTCVETIDPLDLNAAVAGVERVAAMPGVKAIIFKSPCIALIKPSEKCYVDANACVGCQKCIRQLGCPALVCRDALKQAKGDSAMQIKKTVAAVAPSLCTGCGLCVQLCPAKAIFKEAR